MTKQTTKKTNSHNGNNNILNEKLGRVRVTVFEKTRDDDGSPWFTTTICTWYKDKKTDQFRQGSFSEEELADHGEVDRARKLARDTIRKRRDAILDKLEDKSKAVA